jgi:lipoprotein-anchoring transpeptidase ErfK/SrfK
MAQLGWRLSALAGLALAAACSQQASEQSQQKSEEPAPAIGKLTPATPIEPANTVALAAPEPVTLPSGLEAVNEAVFAPAAAEATPSTAPTPADPLGKARPELVRVQVLLDRAHFSPGEIDGLEGTNQKVAIAAFEEARGLPVDGKLDEAVWKALTEADPAPVLVAHTLTADEVAGPYIEAVPKDMAEAAKLPALGYTGPLEALAERFHMSQGLLKALNPTAGFKPGDSIVVAQVRTPLEGVEVASVEVDRARRLLRAYDASGKLIAAYPASVGSTDMPAPSGTWAVTTIAPRPVYYYDPSRLNFGQKSGKLKVAAGPNNPVGGTWIDLSKDTYGIHGTPDPETVGKHQSHGCVRLTNWDAAELAKLVKKGVKVAFVNDNTAKRAV